MGALGVGCVSMEDDSYYGPWYVSVDGTDDGDGTIDNPFSSIQSGINVSVSGDTILVGPGTYSGGGNYLGKQLVILSTDGLENTILEGNISLVTYEDESAIFRGFTLRGAYIDIGANVRALIDEVLIYNSSYGFVINGGDPTISNATLVNNSYGIILSGCSHANLINSGP